ncbi:hypothetical protein [Agromyces sp. NPDC057865]|uniref:hypothetical protein n=1 Tax=Agromyces sp. NPDC057865 TaxID=3346267 RepID=UPI00366CE705
MLAPLVAGGSASIAVVVPMVVRSSGGPSVQYDYVSAQLAGAIVFVVAALLALVVYGLGLPWLPHVVLAGITACAVAAAMFVIGRSSDALTLGALVAAQAMFLSLLSAIAVRRGSSRPRRRRSAPRIPLAVVAVLAGLVVEMIAAVQSAVVVAIDPPPLGALQVVSGSVIWAIPGALATASSVVVVLLVDRSRAPRAVPAIIVGLLTPLLVPYPFLVISGIGDVRENLAWCALIGASVGLLLFLSHRRVAAEPAGHDDHLGAVGVGEPA